MERASIAAHRAPALECGAYIMPRTFANTNARAERLNVELTRDDQREAARKINPLKLLPASYTVRRVGADRYRLKCPLHDDTTPSLSIKRLDSGVWIWKCFGCEERGDSIQFGIQICGLSFVDAIKELTGDAGIAVQSAPRSVIVDKYDYIDESGELLYQVCRMEPKAFRQRRKTDTGWKWGIDGVRRVLYRLPDLKGEPDIWYCEGEKDVAALVAAGFAATTNSGGAGGFKAELLHALPVTTQLHIVPDNDEPGMELCRKLFAAALERGMPVPEIHRVPPPHKDVSDALAAGVPADFLRQGVHK